MIRWPTAKEFKRMLSSLTIRCGGCGGLIKVPRSCIDVVSAKRGEAVYFHTCPECHSAVIGAFGSPEFVRDAVSQFCSFQAGYAAAQGHEPAEVVGASCGAFDGESWDMQPVPVGREVH